MPHHWTLNESCFYALTQRQHVYTPHSCYSMVQGHGVVEVLLIIPQATALVRTRSCTCINGWLADCLHHAYASSQCHHRRLPYAVQPYCHSGWIKTTTNGYRDERETIGVHIANSGQPDGHVVCKELNAKMVYSEDGHCTPILGNGGEGFFQQMMARWRLEFEWKGFKATFWRISVLLFLKAVENS